MKAKTKRVLWLSPLILALCFFVGFIRHGRNLSGYVASYSILPHDSADVLEFNDGTVMWRTCCGDEPRGTYSRAANGSWIWTFNTGKNKSIMQQYLARPDWFSVTFADANHPTNTFTLKRRLFARWAL